MFNTSAQSSQGGRGVSKGVGMAWGEVCLAEGTASAEGACRAAGTERRLVADCRAGGSGQV